MPVAFRGFFGRNASFCIPCSVWFTACIAIQRVGVPSRRGHREEKDTLAGLSLERRTGPDRATGCGRFGPKTGGGSYRDRVGRRVLILNSMHQRSADNDKV